MRRLKLRTLIAFAVSTTILATSPAQAVNFNLIDIGGAAEGTQARSGFDIATAYWSSVLKDNVTVNLQIGFRPLGPNILGSTGSGTALTSMAAAYSALAQDKTSLLDAQAVAGLQPLGVSTSIPGAGAVTAIANAINKTNDGYVDNVTRLDNDGSVNNSTLAMTSANAKALGIKTDVNDEAIDPKAIDGQISFSNAFAFDFNPSDGIAKNAFDFIGVAIHEIGHALGFISGVDTYDALSNADGTNTITTVEDYVVMNTLDLFRHSDDTALDWSTSETPKFFSLDGGKSQLFGDSLFSTGTDNGDGSQASHWKDSAANIPQLGILDPTSGRGQMQEVTALDLAAYDAIGWNVGFDVLANPNYRFSTADIYRSLGGAVPEPSTWAMMLLGFGGIGGALRRRRGTVAPQPARAG
ncbi:NF038122 family metalloprotease [Sphingomonas sp. PAMC 26621]|uniref:NF038122 family metalloprotease n=1 Tax=Sphingomonas sp. PAMC 26621 TaxID=1112213 RepID=UPI001EE690EE|nr:NF038122 family metalloprotease [Sphingomonas sp. PAMC 26621]